MKPKAFARSNQELAAPENMKDCDPLPIFQHSGGMLSCWELDDADIVAISENRCIWLDVAAQLHPPVRLSTSIKFLDDDGIELSEAP